MKLVDVEHLLLELYKLSTVDCLDFYGQSCCERWIVAIMWPVGLNFELFELIRISFFVCCGGSSSCEQVSALFSNLPGFLLI